MSTAQHYLLIWYSDTQNMTEYHPDLLTDAFNRTASIAADWFFLTGDLVNTYDNKTQWDNFNASWQYVTFPKNTIAGNHDIYFAGNPEGIANWTYYDQYMLGQRNWTKTIGDNLFIGVSLNQIRDDSLKAWLSQQILSNSDKHIWILTHWFLPSGVNDEIKDYLTMFDREFIVLCGHNSPNPHTSLYNETHGKIQAIMHDPQRYEVNGGNGYFCQIDIYQDTAVFTMKSQIEEFDGSKYGLPYTMNVSLVDPPRSSD